jgi:Tol biopolymer transport system component
VLLLASLACAGVGREDLPSDPIAVRHWDREAFRRRVEILERSHAPGAPRREGVADVGGVRQWLGAVSGVGAPRELSRYPGHLSLYDPHTGKLSRIDAAPSGSRPLAWSPDHRRLMFATAPGGRSYEIWEYDLEKQEVRSIASGSESYLAADYGPDGRIVYGAIQLDSRQSTGRIYTAAAGGASPTVITEGALAETLRWSPTGDPIVFVVRQQLRRGLPPRLLLIRQSPSADAEAKMLTTGRDPTFTPDGEWIVYSAPVGREWKLRRMRADGSGRAPLGRSTRDEVSPAVSPDGRFVVYVAREGGQDRMFIRRMDGSGDRVLPADGSFENPVW